MTIVRPATLADINTLVDLMREFYAESSFALDSAWAARAFAQLITEPSLGAVWIMEIDGEPVGHVVLTVRYAMEFGGLSAIIDDLFVRQAFRRQGAARAGLDALFAESRRRSCRSIHVEVDPANIAANELYAAYGLALGADSRQHLGMSLPSTA